MSCPFTHPTSFVVGVNPQKARREQRHGRIGMKRTDTPNQIIQSQKYNYFPKQKKEYKTK